MRLKGKVALVTGGGTGIGRGAALALAKDGAKVAVMGRRLSPLEETVEEIKLLGGSALACPGDVTLRSDIEKARILISNEWDRWVCK
ncbi:MAG TPA: SDR family NAD(P)-dependent oxidoreductase [Syntrophomonadaceae bacterium]|nr:SDR family NAD(P)-dependent oxidoreductase [Syntrophomonadaceae bacterium]